MLQGQSTGSHLPSLDSPAAFATRSSYQGPSRQVFRPPANPSTRYPQQRPTYRPNSFHSQQQRYASSFNPNYNGPYFSGPNSASGSKPAKPQCQICLKIGHTAKICYFRFSEDREASQQTPQPSQQPSTFHAYLAQPTEGYDENSEWILDSGATNHVTSDLNNFSSFYAYEGTKNLQIDNGEGLPISHIGFASFQVSNHKINLHNILHVPQFSKNLISLLQLLLDNPHLIIEFTSSSCIFKDRLMRTSPL